MPRIIAAIIISLVAGLAIGAWLGGGDDATLQADRSTDTQVAGSNASVDDRLAYLEQIVLQEREARIALEDTLAALFEDFEQLEIAGQSANQRSTAARNEADRQREERRSSESRRGGRSDAEIAIAIAAQLVEWANR